MADVKTVKVTQIGSPIRRTKDQRATLIGLGLNKMHRTRELQDTPEAEIRKALPEDTIAAALAAKKVQRFLLDNAQVTTVTDAPEKE